MVYSAILNLTEKNRKWIQSHSNTIEHGYKFYCKSITTLIPCTFTNNFHLAYLIQSLGIHSLEYCTSAKILKTESKSPWPEWIKSRSVFWVAVSGYLHPPPPPSYTNCLNSSVQLNSKDHQKLTIWLKAIFEHSWSSKFKI